MLFFRFATCLTQSYSFTMKKSITLFAVLFTLLAQAQFVNQLVYQRSFTPQQIDSVLASQGVPSGIFPIAYGAKAYKIIYNTVSWDSTHTIASGLMIIPDHPTCKVGIISYQHGTTIKKSDVPSRFNGEWFIALAGAAKGLVSLMPDYLGLGDGPGLHPYQHAHTEATAVIDMIRAAKEVVDTLGAPVNDQLFLMGYSQGGHATMAAHQLIQEQLDNVMHVTASAPMSGAYDMSGVMGDVMVSDSVYPEPYYLPYLLFGYNQIYHLYTNTSDVMVPPYDTILEPLFDGNHNGGQINSVMPNVPKLIMQPYQIDSFKNDSLNFFKVTLRENNTYNWVPTSPVRMYFCKGDHSVPYQNAVVAYQHFIQNGATLVDTVNISSTLDHYPCAQFAILGGVNWLNTFAYLPLSSSVSATDATTANAGDGTATATGINGNPHYTYNWNTGDTAAAINGLNPGTYYVTITDGNLCTRYDSVQVGLASGISNFTMNNLRIYPNPASSKVQVEWSNSDDHIRTIEMHSTDGRLITTYLMNSVSGFQLLFDDLLPQGIYYLSIKTEKGKEANRRIVVL